MAWSVFRKVKSALDSADIEGLLALERCPLDEYDHEASLIEDGIARATSFGTRDIDIAELETIVQGVWNSQFGPFSNAELEQRRAAFRLVAQKIKN